MKFTAVLISAILVAGIGSCSKPKAQTIPIGTRDVPLTYTVISPTGGIVGIPVLNSNGLTVNVATGSAALQLQNIYNNPNAQNVRLGDDSSTNVPLGFNFPFWGQTFNNSWMYSNGLVSFKTGDIPSAGCCAGLDLSTTRNSTYNYLIAPMWTDLIDRNGNATWYLRTANSMTYGWYGTYEYGTNNQSSFEVNINSSGAMDVRFGGAFVSQSHTVTSGMTGNLANGEYFQYYHGAGFSAPTSGLSWGIGNTTVNLCYSSPLSDPSCPGYQAAYTAQQCIISALYDPSCPGYQQAYHDQQCSINPLYATDCTGYQSAYHNQQCSINPLYATDCTGYQRAYTQQQCSINPLYSTRCSGYQQAYHDQQCSINSLYATDCPGYQQAYHDQQCTANPLYATDCTGYQQAYTQQQCNLNPLYSNTCPGYQKAYHDQQCTANPLYATDCVGYEQAYLNAQCIKDSLYSKLCSGYATAYAIKYLVPNIDSSAVNQSLSGTAAVAASNPTSINTNGIVSTTPSATGNSTVDTVISTPSTTSATSVSPASTNSVIQAPAAASMANNPVGQQMQQPQQSQQQNNQQAQNNDRPQGGSQQQNNQQPKQASNQNQKEQQSQKGQTAMKEVAGAKSMEQQKANQAAILASMAFVPGFDAYSNSMLRDGTFYKPYSVYGGQVTVDNARVGRSLFGTTDSKYNEMYQQQFKGK